MTTARTLITKAMQAIGVLYKSETPSSDEIQDGLFMLNSLLSSLSNESLSIYVRVTEEFPLSNGVIQYSIGPGQTMDTIRPIYIVQAHVRDPSGLLDYNLSVIPDEIYQQIQFKTQQGITRFLNYSNGYPTGTVKLYPAPTTGYSLIITSEKELTQFELDDVISFPPGWELMLIHNLAILLAPQYNQPVSGELATIAKSAKKNIQQSVAKNRTMDAQGGGRSTGNIYNGWYR